ncbi:hypothetical protein PR001_g23747 [Phytophthora rubi]|uniref:Uncharacterized protein n=1 Tax=Phytophthora rubi TaxID=129364 RepID=A0A6A3IH72_9STRA|nr:hypothetical protein PR001_g23747 [Phytophthora rubi]
MPRAELPAGSTPRPSRASGVSDERDSPFIDLTTPQEFDRESEESSRASSPRPSSPRGGTTSDTAGSGQSGSAGQVTLASLEDLIRQEAHCRQQENGDLARLLSFAFTRPVPPADRLQRRALLDARSVAELTHVLRGQYSPLSSAHVVADLRQELGVLQTLQGDQARRLDSLASENAELQEKVKEAELERSLWEREAKKASPFLTSLRKALAKSEAALKLAQEKQIRKVKSAFKHSADHAVIWLAKILRDNPDVCDLSPTLGCEQYRDGELFPELVDLARCKCGGHYLSLLDPGFETRCACRLSLTLDISVEVMDILGCAIPESI